MTTINHGSIIADPCDRHALNHAIAYTHSQSPYSPRRLSLGHLIDVHSRLIGSCGVWGIVPARAATLATSRVEQTPSRPEWAAHLLALNEFVGGLSRDRDGGRLISPELARTSMKVWWKLYGSCAGDLSIPDVGPGPGGELIFIWRRHDHYLSVEMAPGTPAEIFYRNQRTGVIWGVDFDPSEREVSTPIVEKLSFFLDND